MIMQNQLDKDTQKASELKAAEIAKNDLKRYTQQNQYVK